MSLTRLLAVARKEVIQILRDSRSLGIVVIMPVTLMLLFGYGVNLDLKGLPIYVFDRDGSQQSQDLLKRFQASEYFKVERVVDNYPAITRALDDGHAKMGIVIPWDFSARVGSGGPVQVQALVDGTDDNTANVAIGYAQAVVQGYSAEIQTSWLLRHGQSIQPAPVSVETRTWYNEDLESSAFIVPGVLALVMSVIGAFLTSLTIAREWERGSQAGALLRPRDVRCGCLRRNCDLLVPRAVSRLASHSPFQLGAVSCGCTFSWVFHISAGEEPVCCESGGAAGDIPSGFPSVRFPVFD